MNDRLDMTGWALIKLPYATFRLEVENGIVVKTAPIARWMQDKRLYPDVSGFVARKGGTIEFYEDARVG